MRRRQFLSGAAIVAVPALLGGCATIVPRQPAAPRPEDPWLERFSIDRDALERVRRTLGGSGADFGEVYFQLRRSSVARTTGDEPGDQPKINVESTAGAGLRVVRGDDVAFRSEPRLDEASLVAAASAVAGSGEPAPVPDYTFTPPGGPYPVRPAWSDVADSRRRAILDLLDSRLRAADPAITSVDLNLADTDEWILIATLDGRLVADRRPLTRLSAQVEMSVGGQVQSGFASIAGRESIDWYTDERIDALVATAIDNTRILFDARMPPAGELPVVLSAGSSGVLLHECLGHAFEADFVATGETPYAGRLGERIADNTVTIVDDATLPAERGALFVDDEGEPGRRNVIVEAGQLRSFIGSREFDGVAGASAGNARRESFAHAPLPRMTCTFMENGGAEPAELLATMERGILVETYTGGTADPGTGDFRFRARHGWYVEGGEKRVPVRDFELVGNGPQMLADVTLVANDFRMDGAGWLCGKKGQAVPVSHGMPSVLVTKLGIDPAA